MSGVIDDHGQQWEHCNECGKWVKIQHLRLGWSQRWKQMADLCPKCFLEESRREKTA